MKPIDGKPAAYVCRNFTCGPPATSVEELDLALRLDEDLLCISRQRNDSISFFSCAISCVSFSRRHSSPSINSRLFSKACSNT